MWEHYRESPPVHLLIQGYMGIKRSSKGKESEAQPIEDLFAMIGGTQGAIRG